MRPGLRHRAADETLEEAGYRVAPEDVTLLGGSFFLAPGILSEKIHPTAVDVTGRAQERPEGDGSPLEEGATLHWWPIAALLDACRTGEVEDAKTELSVARFMSEGVRRDPRRGSADPPGRSRIRGLGVGPRPAHVRLPWPTPPAPVRCPFSTSSAPSRSTPSSGWRTCSARSTA